MSANQWADAIVADGLRETVDEMVFVGVNPTFDPAPFLTPNLRRLVVVDPLLDLIDALDPVLRSDPRVATIDASLDEISGTATLHVYNHGGLSSIRSIFHPLDVFPNARAVAERVVRTVSASDFLGMLDIGSSENDPTVRLLAVAAPGLTHMVIASLVAGDRLSAFEHVLLHAPRQPLHEKDAPAAQTLRLLQEAGYRTVLSFGDDPLFIGRCMRRDPLTIEVARLRAELGNAQTQMGELARMRADAQTRAQDAERALAEAAAQRDQAQNDAASLATRLTASETARANAQTRAQDAERALAEATAQRDQAQNDAASLATRLTASETARADAQTRAQDAERALAEAAARIAQLEDALDGAERHGRMVDDEILRAEAQLDLLRQIVTSAAHSR